MQPPAKEPTVIPLRIQMYRCAIGLAVCTAALVLACGAYAQSSALSLRQVIGLLRSRQYSQALKATDHLLAAQPHDCRLLSLRGLAQNGLRKPAEAADSFKQALRYCPDDLLALEGAAQIEYARHQPDAIPLLQRILKLRPGSVTSHAMLAALYRKDGKCREALPHFAASSRMFASRPKFQQAYAFCLADTGKYKQAAANYRQVLGSSSNQAARFNLALVEWKLHESKQALKTLQPLLADKKQEAVLTLGARLAQETGNIPLAVKLLREAILAQPKNLANYLEFAQIAFNHHSAKVGIDMINAGLTQLPNAARLYLARGVLEVQLSKYPKAIADFEHAHKLEPQLSLAMDAMGIMESQQYKHTAALKLFRKQARLHPKDSLLQYLYAESLSESSSKGATQQAIAAARKSIAINPHYAPVRDLLALLYLHTHEPKRALEEAQAALRIDPTDDTALYHEIMARRRLGQTAQVQKLVKELAVMRRSNAQRQKAHHHYVLKDEMSH